ncbi:uncharacterized protein [Euwallacea fornicatus]|uniref:uncharacterized protein n=1 Tax=Euwallacea fornicatus TaxID=995702 RepID=UPI00338DAF78
MIRLLLAALSIVACTVAIPANRWPNLGPSQEDVIHIRPTSEHRSPDHLNPTKDEAYHSTYSALGQLYPPGAAEHKPTPSLFEPAGEYFKYPTEEHHKKVEFDEATLRKHYNAMLDKNVKKKTHFIQKAVEKTIDVTAKLAKTAVDFINKVAIETAAKLAKTGAKNIIHKKAEEKYKLNNHHY